MAWNAQKLLTAIRDADLRKCITEAHLVELTGLNANQVRQSAATLCKNGLLEKTGKGCHKITRAGKQALAAGENGRGARVWPDTLRVRIWRAIRIRRKFSIADIIALVADENSRGDITSNVQKYVRALTLAGYLVEMSRREQGTAPTSNGYKRWWLQDAKDTGPKAPVWRAGKKSVYDPNTDAEIDISGVTK